jgi:VIT1/CCC1 family predicted Fe2+/Mn2+ transporter
MTRIRPTTMGFHDGVVSISVLLISLLSSGVPAVTPGIAAAFAGAVSMSLGEFSSVSSAVDNGIDHESPIGAAVSSFVSFLLGALIPILMAHQGASIPEFVAGVAVLAAMSAHVSHSNVARTVLITLLALGLGHVVGQFL